MDTSQKSLAKSKPLGNDTGRCKKMYILYFVIEKNTVQFFVTVLNTSSRVLNHSGYLHIEVCNDTVQHLMRNSPDLHSNVTPEHINSLGIVSIEPVF